LTIWNTVRGSSSFSSRRTGGLTSDATSWSKGGPDAVLPSAGAGGDDGRGEGDATVGAAARLYCQLFPSYSPTKPLNGHSATPPLYSMSPENTPFNSSVSLKSSPMIVAAFV
jgi:hypothetical protein